MSVRLAKAIAKFTTVWPFERPSYDWIVDSGDMIPYLYDAYGEEWGGYNSMYDYMRTKMLLLYLTSLGYGANKHLINFDNQADDNCCGQLRDEIRNIFFPIMKKEGVYILCDDTYCDIDDFFENIKGCVTSDCIEKIRTAMDEADLLDPLSDYKYFFTLFISDNINIKWNNIGCADVEFQYNSFLPSFAYPNVILTQGKYKNRSGIFVIICPAVELHSFDYEDISNLIDIPSLYMICMDYRLYEKGALLNGS